MSEPPLYYRPDLRVHQKYHCWVAHSISVPTVVFFFPRHGAQPDKFSPGDTRQRWPQNRDLPPTFSVSFPTLLGFLEHFLMRLVVARLQLR